MKRMLAVVVLLTCGASYPAAAAPSGATMLAPGIYTTPEISRKCQIYTGRRVSNSGVADTERQSVFLACVQKLYRDQNGSAAVAPPAGSTLIEAPVSLSTRATAPYGYGCSTDEGYGRRGTCDSF